LPVLLPCLACPSALSFCPFCPVLLPFQTEVLAADGLRSVGKPCLSLSPLKAPCSSLKRLSLFPSLKRLSLFPVCPCSLSLFPCSFQGNGIDIGKLLDENAHRFADKWGLTHGKNGRAIVRIKPWRRPVEAGDVGEHAVAGVDDRPGCVRVAWEGDFEAMHSLGRLRGVRLGRLRGVRLAASRGQTWFLAASRGQTWFLVFDEPWRLRGVRLAASRGQTWFLVFDEP
jgi:hypothetical protein